MGTLQIIDLQTGYQIITDIPQGNTVYFFEFFCESPRGILYQLQFQAGNNQEWTMRMLQYSNSIELTSTASSGSLPSFPQNAWSNEYIVNVPPNNQEVVMIGIALGNNNGQVEIGLNGCLYSGYGYPFMHANTETPTIAEMPYWNTTGVNETSVFVIQIINFGNSINYQLAACFGVNCQMQFSSVSTTSSASSLTGSGSSTTSDPPTTTAGVSSLINTATKWPFFFVLFIIVVVL